MLYDVVYITWTWELLCLSLGVSTEVMDPPRCSLPRFYTSSDQTNQTLALEKAFWVFNATKYCTVDLLVVKCFVLYLRRYNLILRQLVDCHTQCQPDWLLMRICFRLCVNSKESCELTVVHCMSCVDLAVNRDIVSESLECTERYCAGCCFIHVLNLSFKGSHQVMGCCVLYHQKAFKSSALFQ